MSIKNERMSKIKSFMRMQAGPVTVTEIHEALSKRMHMDVSRKTIERDMFELTEKGIVAAHAGVPSKYVLNKPTEIQIVLKVEEIESILEQINPVSEISLKLKRYLI